MKTIAMLIIAVILTATIAAAQSTAKVEVNQDGKVQYDLLMQSQNAFGYACLTDGWNEAYVGLNYSPAEWCEVALGTGIESDQVSARIGGWVWLGKGRVSFIHLFEDGGSGPWHKTTLMYKISDNFKAGLIDRAFYGRGITAECNLGHGAKLGGAWYEGGNATVSLSHSF